MKKVLYFVLALITVAIGFCAGFVVNIFVINKFQSDVFVSGDLSIHFLELGNSNAGDCIYIKCGETDMLIDAGSKNNSASTIIGYVDEYVTDGKLEYVVATHAHEDHIAAFYSAKDNEGIFEHYDVGTIIDFPLTNSSSSVYTNYITARDNEIEQGAKHWNALECYNNENGATRTYSLSNDVEFEILYNYYYDHTQSSGENDYSVCLMINQGDNHYLFTGDLEERGEKKLVTYYEENHIGLPHCVLYKAGHHGSKTSSSTELMSAITPDYIVVCCCAGTKEYTTINENQFPTQIFIDNVAPYTDKVYVTSMVDDYESSTFKSMNGNVVINVHNGEIKVECSNNDTILKNTDWFKANRTLPDAWK